MIDEQRRHHLIAASIASHGEETAMALAESLPPSDCATKADLDLLRQATKADLAAALHSQARWLIGVMVVLSSITTSIALAT